MADQAHISDKSYIVFQAGLGFGAPGDKQLPDIAIVPEMAGAIRAIGTVGEEHPTTTQHGIIESDISATGEALDFVGLCYAVEAFLGTVSPSTVGVTGKQRVWEPSTTAPRYFTNDFGDTTSFQRAIDCFFSDLHLHADTGANSFDAKGKGQMIQSNLLTAGMSLASSPTVVAQKTSNPLNHALYISTSLSGLDTAAFELRNFVWDFNVGGRWGPIRAMNPSLAGNFDGVVRKKPSAADGMIQMGADVNGWTWLSRALNNTTAYVRWSVYGDEIAAGTAEVQTITRTSVTSGTWTLTLPMFGGLTLTGLAWDITAAALQALINGLVYRGAAAVTVSLSGVVYTVTFPAILGNVAVMTTVSTSLVGGTAVVGTGTPGVAPINYLIQVDMAVAAKEFPKRTAGPEELDVLDVPLLLMKTSTLNGYKITIINETATL